MSPASGKTEKWQFSDIFVFKTEPTARWGRKAAGLLQAVAVAETTCLASGKDSRAAGCHIVKVTEGVARLFCLSNLEKFYKYGYVVLISKGNLL